ncbi:type II toxin-antitoxin system RatA family toxin [Corallococcus carmarthensis]|uniref:SRPBCC family protein n=1 Tax=Corallococcus carmarthensis TaxID=2316728 RepID=A0A3A8KFR4_9BACT|nr:SRPBCC family protein [Corallococcus carmarthensis]NOK21723.1 SRPBCC family protein [Corallococcus carmarthensis]RKH06366.1 SRPBCC family protein [Corallococcus carmarthensis]
MRFTESIRITCPRERVFAYTQDYGQRLVWDTFLREAVLMDGATEAGPGVKAWCVSWHGLGMETQYVSFQPPAVTAVKMTRGPRLFESFAGSWRFDEDAPGGTLVTFTYAFELRRPFGWLTPLMKRVLVREVRGRLRDLKQRLDTEVTRPA